MYNNHRRTQIFMLICLMAEPGGAPMCEHRTGLPIIDARAWNDPGHGLAEATDPSVLGPRANEIRRTRATNI